MTIRIENLTNARVPRRTEANLEKILSLIPREHSRGVEKLRLVDAISDPRLSVEQRMALPGLYHPKQGSQPAWIEVSIHAILPQTQPYYKRWLSKLSFQSNLAAVIFSLIGQHYYLTLRHSVKKGQIEPAVKAYTEKYLRMWGERQHSFRSRLFKPLQPTFERWARSLQRKAAQERKRNSAN